ncbi:hypothetical protein [Flavobacterium pallidum]|uniref:Glycosyltransferase RgtA/B/C/D-like domain-containing protein n=1 Tax=Flavobacterium pallidum TaxID=2172098 RepID=A0A2S1SH33_9FLAO|nr:hypothetical protein [Flavobacterium pallidum]AWI25679.1 hypothetical protein HYN49_07070 [Flavobacterium pallidum]
MMAKINTKLFPLLNVLFLLANLGLQFVNFKFFFLNPLSNADEGGYLRQVSQGNVSWSYISGSFSQPYTFLGCILDFFIKDAALSNRIVSLIFGMALVLFLFFYFRKHKSTIFTENPKFWNDFALFNIFFAVVTIIRGHFQGTPDMTSTFFTVIGFIMLIEIIFNHARDKKVWLIGLFFALAFTARPTFLVMMVAFLLTLLLFYRKALIGKPLLLTGVFFAAFTAAINLYPITEKGNIVLDVKEIPESVGTNWFEMNYLMAKKWDAGEIPRTQWLSSAEVMNFKKMNPDHVFPKNHFDLLIREPGLYSRQMLRMGSISIYSSFRYLYLFFPFLLLLPFVRKKYSDQDYRRKAGFIICFYFSALFIYMFFAVKLMEFRWMHAMLAVYIFYALDFLKYVPQKQRLLLFNGTFVLGILFCIVAAFRGV